MESLLSEKQAASRLGVSVHLLRKWRAQDRSPLPYVKLGRCVRYQIDQLATLVHRCEVPKRQKELMSALDDEAT